MKNTRILFFIVISILILYSCRKEYSLENRGKLPVDTINTTCKIEKIIESDYFSRIVEYTYNTSYTADHKVSSVQLVDSLNNSVDYTFGVSYTTGKIQVDAQQYFLTGSDGKVTEFHGFEFPEDNTSDRFTVKYAYNTIGQLIRRTEEYDLFPGITSFEMDYTYAGSNLTRTEAKVNNGTTLQTFIDITYEYETTRTIRNFIYFNAVAPEIFYFQTAIDAGPTSINPVKKATTVFKNYNTGQDSTTVSNFVNYSYDAQNRVISFELTGDDFSVNNLYSGKEYIFKYSCY